MHGYLAEALAHGYGTAQLPQLQAAAGFAGSPEADALLVKVQRAVVDRDNCSLGYVKQQVPLVTYGQIKVVAALVAAGEGGRATTQGPTREHVVAIREAWTHPVLVVSCTECTPSVG